MSKSERTPMAEIDNNRRRQKNFALLFALLGLAALMFFLTIVRFSTVAGGQ